MRATAGEWGAGYECEREGEQVKDLTACKYCKEKGYLVMNIGLVDEVCEACGKWQGGIYSDTYERVG